MGMAEAGAVSSSPARGRGTVQKGCEAQLGGEEDLVSGMGLEQS